MNLGEGDKIKGIIKSERAIAIWIFSKIVMLIFLFMTLGIILSYMHMINERVSADSAEALTMQIKNTIQSLMTSEAIGAQLIVPLPATLPEPTYTREIGGGGYGESGKTRAYTLNIYYNSGTEPYISVALAWGVHDPTDEFSYAAASWLMIPSSIVKMGYEEKDTIITEADLVSGEIYINSIEQRFFVARKERDKICLLGCLADLCEGVCQ